MALLKWHDGFGHRAASFEGRIEILRLLLEKRAYINARQRVDECFIGGPGKKRPAAFDHKMTRTLFCSTVLSFKLYQDPQASTKSSARQGIPQAAPHSLDEASFTIFRHISLLPHTATAFEDFPRRYSVSALHLLDTTLCIVQ